MEPIHPEAAIGFAKGADAYDRARPGYPPAAVDWLTDRLGLEPGRVVLDLAAGTGKLTAALVPTGVRVVAVEPVAEMRALLARDVPTAAALDGTAEALPLPDAAVDGIVVAQAFHWFATTAALAEMRRVLDVRHPRAGVVLLWNRRDLDDPVWARVSRLIEPHRQGVPAHRDEDWRRAVEAATAVDLVDTHEVAWRHELDAEGLVDRVASTSVIAALPEATRAALLDEVRALLPPGSTYGLRYACELHLLRLAAA